MTQITCQNFASPYGEYASFWAWSLADRGHIAGGKNIRVRHRLQAFIYLYKAILIELQTTCAKPVGRRHLGDKETGIK